MSEYKRRSTPIRELMNHPDVDVPTQALNSSVSGLHKIAPNIAQSLQTTGARALGFLNDQMPKPQNEFIGDAEYEPSKSQQQGWLHLHNIVNDPISVLDHVRHGTLTSAHMQALQQVHPELLQEMQQKVMEEMEPAKVRKLPSSTKMALSTFLGSPMSEALLPQAVMANQATFQPAAPAQNSTLGGLKELDLGKRAATRTQTLEEE